MKSESVAGTRRAGRGHRRRWHAGQPNGLRRFAVDPELGRADTVVMSGKQELGVGFVQVVKDSRPDCDSDLWVRRTSPPDYADRH